MAGGMARSRQKARVTCTTLTSIALTALLLVCVSLVHAQGPVVAPLPKQCEAPGTAVITDSPLPNVAAALKERKKITILAIGSTSASLRGPVSGGHYAVVKSFLEATFKGLEVEIVHRGVSGELARDAAERIKTEVALTEATLVLWQLGTADALAQVPVDEFRTTVADAIQWLKEHKIDVILVGLRYTRNMAKDEHYQAIRTALHQVAKEQKVLRIGRYESEEMMERIRREQDKPESEVETSEAGYACLAEYLARAIAAGLFVKPPVPNSPDRKSP